MKEYIKAELSIVSIKSDIVTTSDPDVALSSEAYDLSQGTDGTVFSAPGRSWYEGY